MRRFISMVDNKPSEDIETVCSDVEIIMSRAIKYSQFKTSELLERGMYVYTYIMAFIELYKIEEE